MKLKCLRCGVEWDHWQAAGMIPPHGSGDDLCPNGGRLASAESEGVLWERADHPQGGGTGVAKPPSTPNWQGPHIEPVPPLRAYGVDPLTPWDHFAIAALRGILAATPKGEPWSPAMIIAGLARDYANAMMVERAKRNESLTKER